MRPKSVTIFGKKIPVKYMNIQHQGAMGLYVARPQQIIIDKELKGEEFRQTLLHEMFHALVHRLNIQLTDEQEEMLVDVCAVMIDENFTISKK